MLGLRVRKFRTKDNKLELKIYMALVHVKFIDGCYSALTMPDYGVIYAAQNYNADSVHIRHTVGAGAG
ncbi:hypothetical protein GCM10007941_31890 [Amphritea balenae]|nr:hypothetical protein GCM10007941_31890 [Amphritea balenae]